MLDPFIPRTAADTPTLFPPEPEFEAAPDTDRTPWNSWIPAAPYWNNSPTALLPPPGRTPIPIPADVILIPTDILPPPMLERLLPVNIEIAPPPLLCALPIIFNADNLAPPTIPAPPPVPDNAPLPLTDFPIERCAAIQAALALHPNKSADILAMHHIDDSLWQMLRRHWDNAIHTALREGDVTLLHKHDAAFVAHIENERGPITRDDHSRMQIASERGTRAETLAALELPKIALQPIMRVLVARTMARSRRPAQNRDPYL